MWPSALAPGLMAAAAGWGLLRWFERSQVYKPDPELGDTPETHGASYEEVEFVAEDGCPLHGWWLPHPGAAGTVLYCHGNAGNISGRAAAAAALQKLGHNVFLFDYRGYGRSRGRPSEHGTYRDARAAFELARARHGDAESPPVVAYGGSLGGAVAIRLALEKPLRGLIVENSFTSIPDIGEHLYPWLPVKWVIGMRYNSLSRVPSLTVPTLWAHSADDALIPAEMGRRLYESTVAPKRWVSLRGPHGEGGWLNDSAYLRTVDEFLRLSFGAARRLQ